MMDHCSPRSTEELAQREHRDWSGETRANGVAPGGGRGLLGGCSGAARGLPPNEFGGSARRRSVAGHAPQGSAYQRPGTHDGAETGGDSASRKSANRRRWRCNLGSEGCSRARHAYVEDNIERQPHACAALRRMARDAPAARAAPEFIRGQTTLARLLDCPFGYSLNVLFHLQHNSSRVISFSSGTFHLHRRKLVNHGSVASLGVRRADRLVRAAVVLAHAARAARWAFVIGRCASSVRRGDRALHR
jgi:hypothetical protein